ncbi:MAG: DUF763 domain-containing protein [Deltaproteobacteria bacterium]|nr:DUF763 domain-containing protein [Deltaproteobacteria bacterium]
MRTGFAQLPLHGGKAPHWLFSRMVLLAREVACHVVAEFGPEEMLRRLSDPYWFQAFGCALGFDWHSSGLTTTACGALKEGIRGLERELGLFAAGGKGAASRKTPAEIERACETASLEAGPLVYASRMSAKVDSAAVQDGYQIYHHCFFFTGSGRWCVVQQGMNEASAMARRYHWLGERLPSFVAEPHAAVCCDARGETLNFVAEESAPARTHTAALARTGPGEVVPVLQKLPELVLPRRHLVSLADVDPRRLERILLKTRERAPADFESLLGIEGVGAKTVRALGLVAELIYGAPASVRDPARFSFAHGGKDGTPFPVDRETYDRTIRVLHRALERAKVDRTEKVRALKRLSRFELDG